MVTTEEATDGRRPSVNLVDPYGRRINYLRLSVTDRCNLRCRYCMPAGGMVKVGHDDILSYEALLRIARAAVAIGVEKIRVTGGEPLVRRGIIDFLRQLAAIEGLKRAGDHHQRGAASRDGAPAARCRRGKPQYQLGLAATGNVRGDHPGG